MYLLIVSSSLWQMDILERQGSLFMGSSSVSMETSVIMHNIQRIVKVHTELLKWFFHTHAYYQHVYVQRGHVGVCTKRTNTSEMKMPLKLHVCFIYFSF